MSSLSLLVEAEARLQEFNTKFEAYLDGEGKQAPLQDYLKIYFQVDEAYDKLDATRKATNALLERMSRKLIPERMEEADTKTITLDSIQRRFTVSLRHSCSMDNKPKGMQWLKDNGHGAIVQETVNAQTLASFAKTYIADTGQELPEFFKVSTMTFTSVTKL